MQPGDVLADRFVVERHVDAGGMGIVFRAHDRITGAPVAIKILRSEEGMIAVDRFGREARVLAELHHPAIVEYVAHGATPEGRRFLAMQWLEGRDLAARLSQQGLTLAESVTLLGRVANALASAHARGVVHRDIKPSNVFLEDDDPQRAKVLDFGIARLTSGARTMTRTGIVLGTPGYMAPEQVRGEKVDARADVFSLGCVAYECLTGTRPFSADHGLAMMLKIVLEEAPRIRELRPEVPPELEELVARMLAKSPDARPRDCGEIVRELASLGAMPPSQMVTRAAVAPGITGGEQRLVCVVLAARDAPVDLETHAPSAPVASFTTPAATLASGDGERGGDTEVTADPASSARSVAWNEIVRAYGARLDVLADGAVVATLAGGGSATDQALKAVRCAKALRAAMPRTPIAVATGRREVTERLPVGEAIERAATLVTTPGADPSPVRLDEVTAGLVDTRFDVLNDGASLVLGPERAPVGYARTLLGKATHAVGRAREIATLEAVYAECASESVARVVLVTAPPGTGKSRLRDEVLRRLAALEEPPDTWIGLGDPMRAGAAFGLIADAIRGAAGVLGGERLDVSRTKLATLVGERLRVADAERARVAHFVGELAGVPFDDAEDAQLRAAREDALVMGDQMRRAWQDLVSAACAAGPLVLVLEDVHWGDLPSVRFVDETLKNLRDRPLLVLAFARPEVSELFPALWAKRDVQHVVLGPLTKSASEKLVRQALGPEASDELVARIVERGGGNAFYLEELVRAVARGGAAAGEELPETILAMVQAHLDRLHPDARLLLRAASVFGQTFWRAGVDAVLGGAHRATQLTEWFSVLLDEEIVAKNAQSRFPGTDEYEFRHALLRDGAYGSLTDHDKKLAHLLAGEWLHAAGEREAIALAEHFERGGEPARAVDWFKEAARQALEGDDLDAAISRVERGVRAGAVGERLGELRLIDAEAYIWRSDHARAAPALEEAFASLARGGASWCRAAAGMLVVHAHTGNLAQLTQVVRELREVDPQVGARRAFVMPASFVVSYACALGMYGLADSFLDRVITIGSHSADREPVVKGWLLLARRQHARFVSCRPADHYALGAATANAFERGGDLRNTLLARAWWAHACVTVGAFDEAEEILERTIPDAHQKGLVYVEATARAVLARALARKRSFADAVREAEAAVEGFGASNAILGGFARTALAGVLAAKGSLELAEREARAAVEALAAAVPYRTHALGWLAKVLLETDRVDGALRAAEEAAQTLDALGGGLEDGESLVRLMLVRTRQAAGDEAGAFAAVERASERLAKRAASFENADHKARFLALPDNAELLALATRAR